MKAITVWQPWATLLAIGTKQYETRSWATSYRGPIAIHAGKQIQIPFGNAAINKLNNHNISALDLPLGAVIATAKLVNCWRVEDLNPSKDEMLLGDWTPGRYAWELANVKLLPEPIPAKGHQRLWNWEE